jgi:thioredoxin-dependent peroxiredoxin
MSAERTVTMQGRSLALGGDELQVGDKAPGFTVLDAQSREFRFAALAGGVRVLLSVPSLDTPVCALEARRFDEKLSALDDALQVLAISMDLPFALSRWCGATGIERVRVFSDHRDAAFGSAYGMLIPELRLLARSVFVIDADDVIRYVQLVPDIGDEPDYDAVLRAVRELVG